MLRNMSYSRFTSVLNYFATRFQSSSSTPSEPLSLTTYALRRMMASCAHALALAEEDQDAIGNWVDRASTRPGQQSRSEPMAV
eukprot:229130-Amphidinium_carterae.1